MLFKAIHITTLIKVLYTLTSTAALPLNFTTSSFGYGYEKLKGVNVGGWLLLEPWITPTLFEQVSPDAVDEFTLCAALGDDCQSYLRGHWDTFFTKQDFADMKYKYQLNFIRIPIGYWAYTMVPGDTFCGGQDLYLEQAIEWAEEFGLKVWIDLHGLPGSQNGFDNSGRVGDIKFFYNEDYQRTAVDVIATMTEKYLQRYKDTVIGIELANEPFGPSIPLNLLEQYYANGYQAVRAEDPQMPVILHDGFLGSHDWMNQYVPSNNYHDIVLDFHHYVIFTDDLYGKSLNDIIGTVCFWGRDAEAQSNPVVIGEWSAALTDCTKYLNGRNNNVLRYEKFYGQGSCLGKQDIDTYSEEELTNLRRYIEAQLDAYSYAGNGGWVFWNYKTESSLEWDFRKLVDNGIFPPPPYTSRWFPNQCGY